MKIHQLMGDLACKLKNLQGPLNILSQRFKLKTNKSEQNRITTQLQKFWAFQMQNMAELCNFYECERKTLARKYQQQIDQLKREIVRQYKVIALMKQQVQQLMYMLNHKQSNEDNHVDSIASPQVDDIGANNTSQSRKTAYRYQFQPLQTIQEQRTERTLRSHCDQEPTDSMLQHNNNDSDAFDLFNPINSNQSFNEDSTNQRGRTQIVHYSNQLTSMSMPLREPSKMDTFELYHVSHQITNNGTANFGDSNCQTNYQIQTYTRKNSVPLIDISNSRHQQSVDTTVNKQKRTKQFIETFRKNFQKSLLLNDQKRKTSIKASKSRQSLSGSNQCTLDDQQKQSASKLISSMLKDFDCKNKFMMGHKKIELRYQGEKKQGVRHGNGTLYYSNGLCYQGNFKGGLRHGFGVLKFNHIQIYSGNWHSDQVSGAGKIRNCAIINRKKSQSSSSSLSKWISYQGQFKANRFQGEGTLYLQGGEKFLGKFICGLACGEGTMFKKNGQIQIGVWKNSILIQKF